MQIPVYINKVHWNYILFVCLWIIYGCISATTTETMWPTSPLIFTILPFTTSLQFHLYLTVISLKSKGVKNL